MAQYKDVTLTDGRVVRVYRPPYTRIHADVRRRLPEPLRPEVPMLSEPTVTGRMSKPMPFPNDPDYLSAVERWKEAHAEWSEKYALAVEEMRMVFLFKDEQVPEGWDVEVEVGEEMRYFNPEWKPREGKMGRRLDYFEWAIMGDTTDANLVTNAEAELAGIDLEEVSANEASFRDQVEGEASPGVVEE